MSLPGRRILLCVCGGIAAYKAVELVRRLREAGAEVQVAMTENAQRFVGAASLQAVSGVPVRGTLWDEAAEAAMGHIELARWADRVVVAPATADILAKLAHGLADDLVSTLCLATTAPIAVVPAMNNRMWLHPATQANVATLRGGGPSSWKMAWGASGWQAAGAISAGGWPRISGWIPRCPAATRRLAQAAASGRSRHLSSAPGARRGSERPCGRPRPRDGRPRSRRRERRRRCRRRRRGRRVRSKRGRRGEWCRGTRPCRAASPFHRRRPRHQAELQPQPTGSAAQSERRERRRCRERPRS